MDIESISIIKFLQAMSEVNEALIDFAVRLRKHPNVASATLCSFSPSALNVHEYLDNGLVKIYSGSEFGVSATLNNGAALEWWINMTWNEANWRVEYNVRKYDPDKDSSDVVITFPRWKATSADTFIQNLKNSVKILIASADNEMLFG